MVVLRSKKVIGTDSKSLRPKAKGSNFDRGRSSVVPDSSPKPKPKPKPTKTKIYSHEPIKDRVCSEKMIQDLGRPYATEALKFYNKDGWANYELLKPGYSRTVPVWFGFLHHANFTAKKKDDPDAPVELFFAELTTTSDVLCTKVCVSLGPVNNPTLGDGKSGCRFCRSLPIEHPKFGGFTATLVAPCFSSDRGLADMADLVDLMIPQTQPNVTHD